MRRKPARALRRAALKTAALARSAADVARDALRSSATPLELTGVQRRLETIVTAIHGHPIAIRALPDPRPTGRLQKLAYDIRQRGAEEQFATNDGVSVFLPPSMPAAVDHETALTRYRLLALEQAERVSRGTIARLPATDALQRDLYLLYEGIAVDRAIARANPGLVTALRAERRRALEERPPLQTLTGLDREVERLVREALTVDVTSPARPFNAHDEMVGLPPSDDESGETDGVTDRANGIRGGRTADESLTDAISAAARLRAMVPAALPDAPPASYAGMKPLTLWGMLSPPASSAPTRIVFEPVASTPPLIPLVGFQDSVSDAPTLKPPTRFALSERETRHQLREPLPDNVLPPLPTQRDAGDGGQAGGPTPEPGELDAALPPGIGYPEWDCRAGAYVPNGVTVRHVDADEGDDAWATEMLASRGSLLRRVQQQFERLRARRVRAFAQPRGDELDLAASVRAIVERKAGGPASDRLYIDVQPARRGVAIALLVDTSGSTDAQITPNLQVIDIEKIALLLATTAFDALGDAYAVHAFTGHGAGDVRIATIKGFDERSGATTRRRIAALHPEAGTRLGAALRHTTAALCRQPAGHRLLLILSDGRPNDVGYMDEYAVEDSRRAILEARASGVFPYCLTIDREGESYLSHVFGSAGHTVIQDAEAFPMALLRAVRQLLRFA